MLPHHSGYRVLAVDLDKAEIHYYPTMTSFLHWIGGTPDDFKEALAVDGTEYRGFRLFSATNEDEGVIKHLLKEHPPKKLEEFCILPPEAWDLFSERITYHEPKKARVYRLYRNATKTFLPPKLQERLPDPLVVAGIIMCLFITLLALYTKGPTTHHHDHPSVFYRLWGKTGLSNLWERVRDAIRPQWP